MTKQKPTVQRDPLTVTEIRRLCHLQPGESMTLRGLLLTCRASRPYLSAYHCRCCAFYHVNCEGVACLRGRHRLEGEAEELVREEDVFFTLAL